MGFIEFYRVLPSFTGFYRVLPGFTEFFFPGFDSRNRVGRVIVLRR